MLALIDSIEKDLQIARADMQAAAAKITHLLAQDVINQTEIDDVYERMCNRAQAVFSLREAIKTLSAI